MQKLKPKQVKVIELMCIGHTQRKAAELAQVDETTVSRWFRDAEFRQVYDEEMRSKFTVLSSSAIGAIENMLTDDNIKPSIKLQAAKDILDRAGYKPVDKVEQTGGTPTFIFNPIPASQHKQDKE